MEDWGVRAALLDCVLAVAPGSVTPAGGVTVAVLFRFPVALGSMLQVAL